MTIREKQILIQHLLDAYISSENSACIEVKQKYTAKLQVLKFVFTDIFGYSPILMLIDCYQEYKYEKQNKNFIAYDWLQSTAAREARKI